MNDKPYKINRNDYENIYFLSDAHINHNRPWIVEARGFKSIHEHDEWILNQLYSLNENDLLINLGDFTLMSSIEKTKEIILNIKARHFYTQGNHESFMSKIYWEGLHKFWEEFGVERMLSPTLDTSRRFISLYPFSLFENLEKGDIVNPVQKIDRRLQHNITFMGESVTFNIGNGFYYCRHTAPQVWTPNYSVAIYGHSHSNLPNSQPNDTQGKILDIGVDNAKKYNGTCFFKIEEVEKIMKNKIDIKLDHH
jgi:calcineurin-like phosphoesterase family protein